MEALPPVMWLFPHSFSITRSTLSGLRGGKKDAFCCCNSVLVSLLDSVTLGKNLFADLLTCFWTVGFCKAAVATGGALIKTVKTQQDCIVTCRICLCSWSFSSCRGENVNQLISKVPIKPLWKWYWHCTSILEPSFSLHCFSDPSSLPLVRNKSPCGMPFIYPHCC